MPAYADRTCRHSLALTLGSPPVRVRFAGCHVPVDRRQRRARPHRSTGPALRPENMFAYAGARRTQNHMEDEDELRQGTRSIWGRRYPSHRRRMHHCACYGNRARIRLRR